jgi:hypothetical protein
MRMRWSLLLGVWALGASSADPARAASFGTASLVAIGGALVEQAINDDAPAATTASLVDGAAEASAASEIGANHAAVASASSAPVFAASSWTDTFTLSGAAGSGPLEIRLRVHGTLDAGTAPGGHADVTLRSFVGLPGPDDALAPSIMLAAAALSAFDACDAEAAACADPAATIDDVLVLQAIVPYGVPFRLVVVLEANAWTGGSASFAESARLARILVPDGASLAAASGVDYALVPEPGTLLLLASALAALATRRGPRASS